jgi:hypothetical protein
MYVSAPWYDVTTNLIPYDNDHDHPQAGLEPKYNELKN